MAVKFNPFSGQLQIDEKGSGGSSYIDGEVATYNDLPLDGTAALDSAWLVREASGTWLLGRKPAGIYIRTATAGVSRDADYTYAGILPDVFSDANFTLYDDADSTKNAKFQLSGIATGNTRTISVPNKNVTLDDASDARTPSSHASTHHTGGTDAIAPSSIGAQSLFTTTTNPITGNVTISAGRALIYQVTTSSAVTADINLPSSGHQSGDVIVVRSITPFTTGTTLTIKSGTGTTLDTITASNQAYRYTASGTGPNAWQKVLVDTHAHAAADVTSGVFDNARINFAAPDAIGSTTRNTGAFTTLSANNGTITVDSPALVVAQDSSSATAFNLAEFRMTGGGTSNSNLIRGLSSGTQVFGVRRNGQIDATTLAWGNNAGWLLTGGNVSLVSGAYFGFSSSSSSGFANQDTFIRRDAASTIAFRDLANPQTFRIYNTTDAGLTNFERLFLRWNANVAQIGTEAGGTGSARALEFQTGGTTRLTLGATSNIVTAAGGFSVPNNGEYRFGSPACRIQGTSSSPQNITFQTNTTDRLVINDTLVGFGGTTNAFPALKRSSTALQVRLADDSAFAPLASGDLTLGDGVATQNSALTLFGNANNRYAYLKQEANIGLVYEQNATASNSILFSGSGVTVKQTGRYGWGGTNATNTGDLFLWRDAAGVLAQYNGINAQAYRLYNTWSSTTSFERLNIRWATNECIIDAEAGSGGGTLRGIKIGSVTSSLLGFYGVTPVDQPATVADPAGGGTVDTEARTAINAIIDRLQELGLIA